MTMQRLDTFSLAPVTGTSEVCKASAKFNSSLLTRGRGLAYVEYLTDRWIRVQVLPGDFIIVPAGIYHRFTLDESNEVKALRLTKVRSQALSDDRRVRPNVLCLGRASLFFHSAGIKDRCQPLPFSISRNDQGGSCTVDRCKDR